MKATHSVLTRGFLLAMVSTFLAGGVLAQDRRPSPPEVEDWWSWAAAEEGRDRAETRAGDEGRRPRRRPPVGRRKGPADVDRRRGERGRESRRDERAPNRRRGERRSERAEESRGPAFCRTGAGHPVFGMEWCYEHGFGRADYEQRRGDWRYERRHSRRRPERRRGDWRWERRPDLEGILLGDPRSGQFSRRSGSGMLGDVLGRVLGGPLEHLLTRRFGARAPVEGRWIEPREGTHVLQLRISRQPLAELTDYNGDGRVDRTLVASPTGRH